MSGILVGCLFGLLNIAIAAYDPHLVTNLPGQPAVNFQQYAGHVHLNGTQKSLFYWFYEADHRNASSLPLVLWLSGGPGCSSVGAGALSELGPFRTNDSGTGLQLNPYAWNQAANMIFLDSPYGVGYSYMVDSDYMDLDDNQTASDTLMFLVEWLSMFPEYSRNEFFITGESYAGHYVPALATHILSYNRHHASFTINFKGFAIGNPWTAEVYDDPGNVDFLYYHAIIPTRLYRDLNSHCYPFVRNVDACTEAQEAMTSLTQEINMYNVYATNCNSQSLKGKRRKQILAGAYNPCLDSVTPYLNLPSVQEALHVENVPVTWSECSDTINELYAEEDVQRSMLPLYSRLFDAKLRIWIYSGDIDAVVSSISTRSWMQRLNLTTTTNWYTWDFENQVGGWTEVYRELTFSTVRDSGHMAPFDQPGPSLQVFKSFLAGKPLPSFP